MREQLFKHARALDGSPLANASLDHVIFAGGRIALKDDPSRSVGIADAMRAAGVDHIEAEETAKPGLFDQMRYSAYTHSAIFAEVRVDEDLGVIRVTRVVSADRGREDPQP